ncbi:unnamed protein product, partial [Mycena citricolor]
VEYLKARSFEHLDVYSIGKKRDITWGLLRVFKWQFLTMGVLLTVAGLSNFVAPLAVNRVLAYIEDPATTEHTMKPWFWALLLFVGPVTYATAFQGNVFVSTHVLSQAKSILTELVFEHALRIRVKAEAQSEGTDGSPQKGQSNLVGKINTLVAADLNNINEARNIMFILVLVPIQVVGSVMFLYQILGWSTFVGMLIMGILFPLPGYIAKLLADV